MYGTYRARVRAPSITFAWPVAILTLARALRKIFRAPAAMIFIDVAHCKVHCLKGRLSPREDSRDTARKTGSTLSERSPGSNLLAKSAGKYIPCYTSAVFIIIPAICSILLYTYYSSRHYIFLPTPFVPPLSDLSNLIFIERNKLNQYCISCLRSIYVLPISRFVL